MQTFGSNSRNYLTNSTRSGNFILAGTNSATATSVTVNTQSAVRYADNTFAKDGLSLSDGTNTFTAVAQDSYGQGATNAVTVYLPTTVSYTYDSNGNMTSDGRRAFAYDDADQLIRITITNSWKTEFTYNGFNRNRLRKEYIWISGTWELASETGYMYDGRLVIQERDANNWVQVSYSRGSDVSGTLQGAGGIGGLLARSANNGPTVEHAFYHADRNGNITALINAGQQLVAKYTYEPFGRVITMRHR